MAATRPRETVRATASNASSAPTVPRTPPGRSGRRRHPSHRLQQERLPFTSARVFPSRPDSGQDGHPPLFVATQRTAVGPTTDWETRSPVTDSPLQLSTPVVTHLAPDQPLVNPATQLAPSAASSPSFNGSALKRAARLLAGWRLRPITRWLRRDPRDRRTSHGGPGRYRVLPPRRTTAQGATHHPL